MNRRFIIVGILAFLIILLFTAWRVYDNVYFLGSNKVSKLQCHYLAYACGDCYPQWQIDSSFAVSNGFQELIGEDIYITSGGKEVEENFPDSVTKCIICYDFYFTGKMKKTFSGKCKFEAKAFQIKLQDPDCCN